MPRLFRHSNEDSLEQLLVADYAVFGFGLDQLAVGQGALPHTLSRSEADSS